MTELLLAYGAGLLTLINPCVLPLLPIVLAGALSRHPLGPLALAGGMAASFTLFGYLAYGLVQGLGVGQEDISRFGALVMIGFGAVLLVPQASAAFARATGGLASGSDGLVSRLEGRGLAGEAGAGALLGLVWSPCIGPTLGGALALAAQGSDPVRAIAIMAAFGVGTGTILLALGYGSRELIMKRRDAAMNLSRYARPIMGLMLVLVGLGLWFHVERIIESALLDVLPPWLVDLSVSL